MICHFMLPNKTVTFSEKDFRTIFGGTWKEYPYLVEAQQDKYPFESPNKRKININRIALSEDEKK